MKNIAIVLIGLMMLGCASDPYHLFTYEHEDDPEVVALVDAIANSFDDVSSVGEHVCGKRANHTMINLAALDGSTRTVNFANYEALGMLMNKGKRPHHTLIRHIPTNTCVDTTNAISGGEDTPYKTPFDCNELRYFATNIMPVNDYSAAFAND